MVGRSGRRHDDDDDDDEGPACRESFFASECVCFFSLSPGVKAPRQDAGVCAASSSAHYIF